MICYFADRELTVLGTASTNLPMGYRIIKDKKRDEVESGIKTFEFTLGFETFDKETRTLVKAGNYVFRNAESSILDENNETVSTTECEVYCIMETETDMDRGESIIYCEDAGMDLINEIAEAFPNEDRKAFTIEEYVDMFTGGDSGFEVRFVGVDEETVSRKLTLSWDGDTTAAERVRSIATEFGCELYYSFDINNSEFRIDHKYINFTKRRGADNYAMLTVGVDIGNVIVKESALEVCTAVHAIGGSIQPSNGWEDKTKPGSYIWIKFATNTAGDNMSDSWRYPEYREYIGISYMRSKQEKSSKGEDYSWGSIKATYIADKQVSGRYIWFAWSSRSDGGLGLTPYPEAKYLFLGFGKTSNKPTTNIEDYPIRIPNPASSDGSTINLIGYAYDDGDIYVDVNSGYMYSREALKKWSRYINKEQNFLEKHITRPFTFNTLNDAELCTRASNYLREHEEADVNYEVDVLRLEGVAVGDTVRIVDTRNELYLKARLVAMETSIVSDAIKGEFDDFEELSGEM